ncbi:HERV-H LTR-associating protein 2 [Oryzias melastigma]|uniref:HERV-H LTR-associating protein 2 n=1 Tax=Oryzias melastigma TaxID=30732 RepID=A0A834BVN7_ORYME|nr:HERV-H LTR-associating protein 2 [Oryzias melastigma]
MMNRLFRFLFFLIGLWILTTGAAVSCQFGQSCMLPCSFPAGDDTVIHWIQLTPNTARVHSYYENKNQLGQQDPKFKGRTSLFLEEISRGNASLQLTGVMVQDEGTYLCYSNSIIKKEEDGEISVNMTVYARRGQIPSNTESVPNIIYEETNNGEEHENSTPMNYGTIRNNREPHSETTL